MIRLERNSIHIKNYLGLYPPELIKQHLWVWLVFINLFGIVIATCDPFEQTLYNILMSIIMVMDLGIIAHMFNTRKWQREYIFFLGVYCFAFSIVLFIMFYKSLYLMAKIKTLIPLILAVTGYLLILIGGFAFHLHALKTGLYSKPIRINRGAGIIITMSAVGLIIGKIVTKIMGEQAMFVFFGLVGLMLAYLFELGIHNIYIYYLIKSYEK